MHTWKRRSGQRARHAARAIQRWWRRIPRPLNDTDPFTLEHVPLALGRATEEHGTWFDLVRACGLFRYNADQLATYFAKAKDVHEPHSRYALNATELARLDRTVSPSVRSELGAMVDLLSTANKLRRQVVQEEMSIEFFVEDSVLNTIARIKAMLDGEPLASVEQIETFIEFKNMFHELARLNPHRFNFLVDTEVRPLQEMVFSNIANFAQFDFITEVVSTLEYVNQVAAARRTRGGEMLLLGHSLPNDTLVGVTPAFGDPLHAQSSDLTPIGWLPQFGHHVQIDYELVLEPMELIMEPP